MHKYCLFTFKKRVIYKHEKLSSMRGNLIWQTNMFYSSYTGPCNLKKNETRSNVLSERGGFGAIFNGLGQVSEFRFIVN